MAQHGPEKKELGSLHEEGAEVTGYWLHNGSQVHHCQKRELEIRKRKKPERMLWYWFGIRGTGMSSRSAIY